MHSLSRTLIMLLAFSSVHSCIASLPGNSNDTAVPNTPAGKQFSAWLKVFNSGDTKLINDFASSHFAKSALTNIPANERATQDLLIFKENQGFELRKVEDSSDYRLVSLVQSKLLGLWFRITIEVEQASPHGITNLMIRIFPNPTNTKTRKLSNAEISDELRRYVGKLSHADVFSGVVLVAYDGKPFFQQAYGQADASRNRPNQLDTKFNLASMNKMFTAVAIAQLAQQGKLKLDKTVGTYLPDYPNKQVADKVTLHHLLTHTSGLGSYWNAKYEAQKDNLRRVADFLPLFANDPLSFEPGARFQYSNNGFIVLGLIIEKVSGQDYYDYVAQHICKPIGMKSTDFYETDQKVTNLAVGYTNSDQNGAPFLGKRRPNWSILARRGSAAGGGYSTAEDLLKFDLALRSNKLLSPEYTKLVLEGKVQRDELTKYAYGFEERLFRGQRVVGHGGGFPGVSTQLEMYLDSGYTVIVLTNIDTLGMPAVSAKARELIMAQE